MLDQELSSMINDHLNYEWYSSYIYLDISNFYADKNLDGFASWFMVQAQEERDHALLFNKYLLNNSYAVKMQDVHAPTWTYQDIRQPIESALEHEHKVTARINNIYAKAYDSKDFRTMQFLDWFVKEQGEEEKNTETLLKKYELFGSDGKGLYLLDAELATRAYAPPSLVI